MNVSIETQKPNPFSVAKQSFLFVCHNWRQAFAILAFPIFIEFGVSFLELIPAVGKKASLLEFPLKILIDAFISVYWFRFILLGEKFNGAIVPLRLDKNVLRYTWTELILFFIFVLLFIPGIVLIAKPGLSIPDRNLYFHLSNIKNINISFTDICWIASGILWIAISLFSIARFLFVFPTIALGGKRNLRNSWSQMKGITLRLFFTLGLSLLTYALGIIIVIEFIKKVFQINLTSDNFTFITDLLSSVAGYLYGLVLISITSFYYKLRNPHIQKL